ncbi:MAG: glycosyl transferase [Thermoprotei archaeon]|nr:MAG: glycosyl transferase [Thermoprotei archaeon]
MTEVEGSYVPVLAMIVKNSWSECRGILLEVLDSTLQVPYKAFILVDDGADETREVVGKWCAEHGKELVYSRSRLYGHPHPTRATARQTAIDIFLENFQDEWLMFVDDDAVLNPGWWSEAEPHTHDPRVGLVWGLNYDSTPLRQKFLETLGVDYVGYLIRQFEVRGGTHDVLLRRAAIEDIMIPPQLHIFEDAFIKHWVECKGYECRVVKAGIIHKNPGREPSRRTLKLMAEWGLKLGLEDPRYRNPLFGLYALARATAGAPLTVLTHVRAKGVGGFLTGARRAKTKWLYRLYLWLYSFRIKPPLNRCEVLGRYYELAKARAGRGCGH